MLEVYTQWARELRKNQTDAEHLIWHKLKNRKLGGCKFRRQKPIPPYIVDFICIEQKLIIELDGKPHNKKKEYNSNRTRYLEQLGYRVLRFWNNEIIKNCDLVLEKILSELNKSFPNQIQQQKCKLINNPHPDPLPLPVGEGDQKKNPLLIGKKKYNFIHNVAF